VAVGRGGFPGALLVAALALAPAGRATAEFPTGEPGFLVPGARAERVVDGRALDLVFTEGPAVACDGTVFFSDITWSHGPRGPRGGFRAGHILRFDPKTGAVSVFRSPSGMANGLAIDAGCGLLAAEGADRGGRRITRTDIGTGRAEILADSFRDRPLNGPNDLAVDRLGRIWFTDPRYAGREPVEQDGYGVYRLDPDGGLERVLVPEGRPNGIALAPDGASLYLAIFEPGERRPLGRAVPRRMVIERWTVGRRGELREGRVLVDFGEQDGADGLATDREGNLWAAVQRRERPGIYAFDPAGRERAYVPLAAPTNLTFGRPPEDDVLWITADRSLWRLRVGKRGHHPAPR
jgi:gluconolactonase